MPRRQDTITLEDYQVRYIVSYTILMVNQLIQSIAEWLSMSEILWYTMICVTITPSSLHFNISNDDNDMPYDRYVGPDYHSI